MEVDATSFPHHLLHMLVAISEADFVSFDLELSGIPSRMPNKARHTGRQTLEDRYLEAKTGAEKHQILQVGFTCAKFDYITNKYILRPYNINISPLVDERLDIEREFSVQTGAIAFLLKNGFQLDLPFTKGVQYLSRDEAALAKQMGYNRFDKKNVFEDMQLKETDVESLDFVRRVREAITKWKTSGNMSLAITTHTGMADPPESAVITRFEKRLVHQLVRAEFPDVVAMGRADCMKIIVHDAAREEENARRMKERLKEQIVRQTGFRWIVEALARGRVDHIDPMYFMRNPDGMVIAGDLSNIRDKFERAAIRIRDQQPVLVGHNMFTDLVYLYRTFIGELPATLQGFCEAVHDLFPRIVDTKYMATHDGGDLHASPTLQEIAESLEKQELPEIVTHGNHSKYHNSQAFHEAGYDSLLTATIMLRLATKIHAEGHASEKSVLDPQEVTLDGADSILPPTTSTVPEDPETDTHSDNAWPPGSVILASLRHRKKKKKRTPAAEKPPGSRFASNNLFDNLQSQPADPVSPEHYTESPKAAPVSWKDQPYEEDQSNIYPIDALQRHPMEMLPDFDCPFWHKFGNKLRIFGTQETLLDIAKWEKFTTRADLQPPDSVWE